MLHSASRSTRGIVYGTLFLSVVMPATGWSALALWYRAPGPDWLRVGCAGAFVLVGVSALASLVRGRGPASFLPFLVAFAAVLVWWGTIEPAREARWAPDVQRQTTGTVDGDQLTLTAVRNFAWSSADEATERWSERTYDLSKLQTLDLFLSYWAGPEMAHVIMSFGFDDDVQLAWSIEVRRTWNGEFSPLADLFKSNPVVLVAAEESDVVRVRANFRGEDVRLYRLRTPAPVAKALLLQYVESANALARTPQFYNVLTTNCTTMVVRLMRAAGQRLPLDWRLIVNGYLPGYLYDHGAVATSLPLTELQDLARIGARAREADDAPNFSALIRIGVPTPDGVRAERRPRPE